jgi:hypothetical protein
VNATGIATWNSPQRAGEANNDRGFQRLADRGNTVLAGQEIPDADAKRLCPRGWRRHRPGVARSEVIYWDPHTWDCLGRGAFRLHSDKAPAPRYVVWVLLRHRQTGIVRRFGSVHLVAFKTSRHGPEYRHQAERLAEWLAGGPRRVAMGDINGSPTGHWLDAVMKVADVHKPPTKSGPDGQFIDLILTNKDLPRAVDAQALPGFGGDHRPVEATLPLTR